MANGRLDEAEKVVRKAAKMNKMSFDKVIMTVKAKMAEIEVLEKENGPAKAVSHTNGVIVTYYSKNTEVKKFSMIDISKDRLILINSAIIWFIW